MDSENLELCTLPDEILIEIISHLINTSDLALSCRRLYQLVCETTRNTIPLEVTCADIDDNENFQSIMASSRQFRKIIIDLKYSSVVSDSTYAKISAILLKYGDQLEVVKIWSSIQCKPAEMTERQLYDIFSLIPNSQEFTLRNIVVTTMSCEELDKEKELDLPKLRRLELDYCMINSCSVLNKIPQNVLRDLVFTFEPFDEEKFQEFFNRQASIKKLELYENERLSFDHMQLEHLKISSNINYPLMIQQQPSLQYIDFAIAWVNEETFLQVCELKKLRVLKTLIDLIPCRAFKNLQNLTTLKELRLDSHSSYDMGYLQELSLMRGIRLQKLTLLMNERKVCPEIVLQLANNFPHLKQIELINRSIAILMDIVQNMTNLETIVIDFFAIFGAPEDTLRIGSSDGEEAAGGTVKKYENLKNLIVTDVHVNEEENGRNLLKLACLCPNIERLMLSKISKFSNEELRYILVSHKNLSHFSLTTHDMEFNGETVEIIFEWGRKLRHFKLAGINSCLPYRDLKAIFSEKFPILNLYKYSSGESELVMRRRNVEDWHSEFRLMDHF